MNPLLSLEQLPKQGVYFLSSGYVDIKAYKFNVFRDGNILSIDS